MTLVGRRAAEAESAGFESVGVIDRLVYDNLDSLTALVATAVSEGWVAPLSGLALLQEGAAAARRAWSEAGREGRPRIMTCRYFSLGPDADAVADEYIRHYYGADFFDGARADTFTDRTRLRAELQQLSEAGCDDVVLFPCSGDLEQVASLARALRDH